MNIIPFPNRAPVKPVAAHAVETPAQTIPSDKQAQMLMQLVIELMETKEQLRQLKAR